MSSEIDYEQFEPFQFGGVLPSPKTFADSAALILPVPFDRTTSYVPGTRNGPRELLLASAQVELWDEEVGADVHAHGMVTLPEMDLSGTTMADAMAEIGRVTGALFDTGKFLITLGGEHSITSPIVGAAAARRPGLSVLQIDAHADSARRLSRRSSQPRLRHATHDGTRASCAGGDPQHLGGGGESPAVPETTIFYDWNMREDPAWIDRASTRCQTTCTSRFDLDGIEPGLMPAVGTPEPGGLSWRELTTLLRRTFERRRRICVRRR
jgi:agmatinase